MLAEDLEAIAEALAERADPVTAIVRALVQRHTTDTAVRRVIMSVHLADGHKGEHTQSVEWFLAEAVRQDGFSGVPREADDRSQCRSGYCPGAN
jgi:hypothetical protein